MRDPRDPIHFTRRELLAAAAGGAAAAVFGCAAPAEDPAMSEPRARMPLVYLPHGGGPWPFVELGFGDPAAWDALAAYLRGLRELPPEAPRALLVVSAHWEEAVPTVTSGTRPPLVYDYYGFPPEAYTIAWPAPGDPVLAARVQSLLAAAGIDSAASERGFDHGTFVPLKLTYPDADVPTVQLSLVTGLDPARHLAIGRALAPLRDEGVFILGSGMSYHDLRGFGPGALGPSTAFDAWLAETTALAPAERDRRLAGWASAPSARAAHPREEHLLPLMVIAGAAGSDRGRTAYQGTLLGARVSAHQFESPARAA